MKEPGHEVFIYFLAQVIEVHLRDIVPEGK